MRIAAYLAFALVCVASRCVAAQPLIRPVPATRPATTLPAAHCLTHSSLITIHVKSASPKGVFTEIARQAGFELDVHPADFWESRRPPLKPVTLDYDAQPFWTVIKEACHQTGATYRAVRPGGGMTLGRGRGFTLDADGILAGPCLVVPEELRVSARVPQDRPEGVTGELAMSYAVYVEPGARLLKAEIKLLEAVDDRGESMLAEHDAGAPTLVKWNEAMWRGDVPLRYQPVRHEARLALFKADLHLFLQSTAARFELPYPFTPDVINHEFTLAGRRFRINSGFGWAQPSLSITAFRDRMSDDEWAWYGKAPWRCDLFDAANYALVRQVGRRDFGLAEVTFRENFTCEKPMQPGAAVKFVWEIPTELKEIVVPLEFKDWALP